MAELDKFDKLVEFKPFYNKMQTERMLYAYQSKPHLFTPKQVTQLKEHAIHFKMPWEDPKHPNPKDGDFNVLRGIRGMGEGFLSGFSTFQVGEASDNPYERIMRSVGELAGFVGYIPTTPLKILKSKALIDAARSLKGNSVPLWISKKATKAVTPVISKTLGKAAEAKNDAFSSAAKFLLNEPKVGHIAEGAFNLGVASGVSSWQFGAKAMVEGALHGAVTGGVFRGVANLINRGGIPSIDKVTGKEVLNVSQKEDKILRMGAMSIYEGLASNLRGETTPEQVYSWLLGAYFGAHETTAGQAMARKHVADTEKLARTNAKALKRLNDEGKPFQWDMAVYDPRLTPGWKELPKDVQTNVMENIIARHGTYSGQSKMAAETLDRAGLEALMDQDISVNEAFDNVKRTQVKEKADKLGGRLETVEEFSPRLMAQNPDKVYLVDADAPNAIKNRENAKVIPNNLDDANLPENRKILSDILTSIPEDKMIVIQKKGIGNNLANDAPKTFDFLQRKIFNLTDARERAKATLEKEEKIEQDILDDTTASDVSATSDAIIQKKSRSFVLTYLDKIVPETASVEKAGVIRKEAEGKMYDILEKHYNKYNGKTINDEAFIRDVQKAFPEQPNFDKNAQGELRQLLIRRNMQRQVPHATFNFVTSADGRMVNGQFEIMPEEGAQTNAGNSKFQGDSIKAIERVGEILYPKSRDRMYIVLDHMTVLDRNGRYRDIELKDLADKRNFHGVASKNFKNSANRLIQQALAGAEQRGYYYNGGKGTTGKMYFFKHHPKTLAITKSGNLDYAIKSLTSKLDKDGLKYYQKLRTAFMKSKGYFLPGKGQEYFDKAFISNLLWEREIAGLSKKYTLEQYVEFLGERDKNGNLVNTQIPDAKGFNKRNQILLTDGFDLDGKKFKAVYEGTPFNKVKMRFFKDADIDGLVIDSEARKYAESTDGSILVEPKFLDALNESFGLPQSGQNKSFIVSSDPVNGMFLGKFMFHKASEKAAKYMRENDIHMLIPETAAKEYGTRKMSEMKVDADGNVTWGAGAKTYTMELKDIKGSLSEKQTDHMLAPQMIPKQLMANLNPLAKSPIAQKVINEFFEDQIGVNYRGEAVWNDRITNALKAEKLTTAEMNELAMNIDKYGLPTLIDAVKNVNHPELVSKIYQQMLKVNMEGVTADFNSGQIDRVEYLEAIAKAKTVTSSVSRLMNIYPDVSIFLHKNIRNYMQSAMRNYIVNQVTRPKYKYSISTRMRGLDPWLQHEGNMKDLSLGGADKVIWNGKEVSWKKYLKEKYGVKNPDELFFLDDKYKKVKYDVSHILTTKKHMELGDLWKQYASTPNLRKKYPKVAEFFKTISLRVPMDSISGAHQLTFAGFTGIDGHGAIFHPRTMRALGGADLDGDKAFVLFGLESKYRDMYHSNKYEYIDSNNQIRDNKKAPITKEGISILREVLNPKDAHEKAVLEKIKKKEKITYQDLFTTTKDGDAEALNIKKSLIGRFDIMSRMNMADDAAKGRDQLGPAVISKQVLNAVHSALVHNPVQRYINSKGKTISIEKYASLNDANKKLWKADKRESITFKPYGEKKGYTIYIEPRISEQELKYAREVHRSQIAFGSDPLDEIGLTGSDKFFNHAWHATFKINWGNTPKDIREKFSPNFHARTGTYQTFKDFNSAYFGRNWDADRRYYSHEILDMASSIHKLSPEQKNTMLPKMVELLEPLDYTDDMLRRVDVIPLEQRYNDFDKGLAKDLLAFNHSDANYPKDAGGILGRFSFRSVPSPIIFKAVEYELYDSRVRGDMINSPSLYKDFFNNIKSNFYGSKEFWKRSFPAENVKDFKDVDKLIKAINNAEHFRSRMINRVYLQASDFMQNDAMDRTSAHQLLRAIDNAKNTGTNNEFIHRMSKFVDHLKRMERAQKKKQALRLLTQTDEIIRKDDNGRFYIERLLEIDKDLDSFKIQQRIDERIIKFKTGNSYKKKQGGNGKLSAEENYLFDTMMLSTYYKGQDLSKSNAFRKLSPELQKLMRPILRDIRMSGSGTYFEKTGLNSDYVSEPALKDFFKRYAQEFDDVKIGKDIDFKTEEVIEPKPGKSKEKEYAAPDIWEDELAGIRQARERAVESNHKLDNAERQMVDELAGHLNYYHNSIGTPQNLNLIARGLLNKNFDAFTLEDYRVMNRFFADMREGNIFIKDGKLTSDNIVKLSKRHHMLFPRQVSEELMIKDFKIFEQEGRFQNYKGEWVAGMSGRPTQVVESIQYVLGESQAAATKMDEDIKNAFYTELLNKTGYESIPKGRGADFFEIATAERDLRSFKNSPKALSKTEYKNRIEVFEKNLKEAQDRADWGKTKDEVFGVSIKGGTDKRTGRQIVDSINDVLTSQSKKMMQLIYGKHYMWNDRTQSYSINPDIENPINNFVIRNKKSGKVEYWDANRMLPKINADKFTKFVLNNMKQGKLINMDLGLDNLRKISKSIALDQLTLERRLAKDPNMVEAYDELIGNMRNQRVEKTGSFHPNDYHPHFIENKTLAKENIMKAVDEIKKQTGMGEEWQARKIKGLINQYRSLTGEWMTGDIIEDQMLQGALKEIAQKKKGEHLKWFNSNPIAPNMMSRGSNLPGWSRDIGSWDIYHKNLIDTYFRQIGQIASKKMLQDFNETTSKTWKDEGQRIAWNNYIADYISRSLGYPTKLPDHWLKGPEAKLMNIKGTPYAWFADNKVKDFFNNMRKKLGFKDDMRLPEELRGLDEMDIRHWSNLEAKYQMATLLAHPKSAIANIFGGTLHTLQSVGWRNWKNARSTEWLKTNLPGKAKEWNSKSDREKWAIGHGVVPDFILYEAGLNPNFRTGKWRNFLDDAKRVLEKDPTVKDETLRSIAKKHKITDAAFDKAAWFMREPERMLRRDSFIAHYLQAREIYGHANMELDHPLLIQMAKKGVKATQFLYSAPFRPAFSSTALGKVMTRFQTWAWNSVRFRNDVYKQAKIYGFQEGTMEFDRFKRQYLSDMFVFALGNVFAYSIFESAMPAPYNWFQDTADWIFGDEKERDRAFYGQWPTAVAPLQMITPPGLRMLPATMSSIVNNDYSRLTEYYIWTMFPFGRMARDFKGIMENPMRTVEKTTGIPYQQFAREVTKYREEDETE